MPSPQPPPPVELDVAAPLALLALLAPVVTFEPDVTLFDDELVAWELDP
jgi:hypothetical protein